ncbi:MAG: hypothetical protein AAFY43_02185 [Pseudomonadota bacterium]
MTANQTHSPDMIGTFASAGRDIVRVIARVFLAALIVVAAGAIAVTTAIIGLLIGAAALTLRFAVGGRKPRRTAPQTDPMTLDAHRTPRGWTVE